MNGENDVSDMNASAAISIKNEAQQRKIVLPKKRYFLKSTNEAIKPAAAKTMVLNGT